tara:strand:- start:572 stop:1141 length:570 start_codon:yes stop_codon:yes gene_type:complete
MALTKTATAAGSTSPKTAPNSITTVTTNVNPQGQSSWTTSTPYVIYTAPSDCLYARIVIPYKMRKSSTSYTTEAFTMEGKGTGNYWLGLAIVNDTNSTTDNLFRGFHGGSYDVMFNHFDSNGQYDDQGMSITNPFDVVVNYHQSNYRSFFIIHEERWILNPGEKLVGTTGHNSNDAFLWANFEAWVYNA